MPLLADYAITPDVFDSASYSSEEICGLHLDAIRQVMMEEGVVRDLRSGDWRKLFMNHRRSWHRRSKEILKKLATQGRLIEFPAESATTPTDDRGWCAEALAAHQRVHMEGGIIVTQSLKDAYPREPLIEQIDRLNRASWWTRSNPSVRLDRKFRDYHDHLRLILQYANSLQFIDPHLDPSHVRYSEFAKLLAAVRRTSAAPHIEIHRVCYVGSGRNRKFPDFESIFRSNKFANPLHSAGLSAQVFIWDDFHDRYLISNLIGISLPNGFDTTRKPEDVTTWTRLGRDDRDDVQREFDRATRRHKLRERFTVP